MKTSFKLPLALGLLVISSIAISSVSAQRPPGGGNPPPPHPPPPGGDRPPPPPPPPGGNLPPPPGPDQHAPPLTPNARPTEDIVREIENELSALLNDGFQKAGERLRNENSAPRANPNSSLRRQQSAFRKTSKSAKTSSTCRGEGILETSKIIVEKHNLGRAQALDVFRSVHVPRSSLPRGPSGPGGKVCDSHHRPPPGEPSENCANSRYPYRQIDGSCNNLRNAKGSAETPFKRYADPVYEDIVNSMRGEGRTENMLPNPRTVSVALSNVPIQNLKDESITQMVKAWGQFLDHDITLTPESEALDENGELTGFACCDNGVFDAELVENCAPIDVSNDPFFSSHGFQCLPFVRSLASDAALFGVREQMNQITSFIDASNIYGSDDETAASLRTFSDGKMREDPDAELDVCSKPSKCYHYLPADDSGAFLSGDVRVNEQPSLTSLHTMFLRYHNLLADEFGKLSKFQGNDELIYQESRRIIGAIMQHITVTEFLPIVLGEDIMAEYGITSGFVKYDPNVDPSIANVFATCVYRFGHSLVAGEIGSEIGGGVTFPLEQCFFNNAFLKTESGAYPSKILEGECERPSEALDVHLHESVTNKLFASGPDFLFGTDLFALNIQRGRDHGLPGYNVWRKTCGLSEFNTMDELATVMSSDVIAAFSANYGHPGEIDFFAAGLAETPISGGLLGPTFSCIMGRQFRDLIYGDRFWYRNHDQPQHFTTRQMSAIVNTPLASVVCKTTTIEAIQPEPMRSSSLSGNAIVPCPSGDEDRSVLNSIRQAWGRR